MTRLMEAGALDAFVTPIQMKKNRPGVMISVLCGEGQVPALEDLLFQETATLGIRRYPVSRHKLKRQAVEVETPFGRVRGKLGWLGDRPPTFSPEYDDCARIAAERAIPLREVYDATQAAYTRQAAPAEAGS
jgi:pyridinium-3,5-bisthiocarboxylic acid mononucleotide nickel chelatase